jgi:hypothetical protein
MSSSNEQISLVYSNIPFDRFVIAVVCGQWCAEISCAEPFPTQHFALRCINMSQENKVLEDSNKLLQQYNVSITTGGNISPEAQSTLVSMLRCSVVDFCASQKKLLFEEYCSALNHIVTRIILTSTWTHPKKADNGRSNLCKFTLANNVLTIDFNQKFSDTKSSKEFSTELHKFLQANM